MAKEIIGNSPVSKGDLEVPLGPNGWGWNILTITLFWSISHNPGHALGPCKFRPLVSPEHLKVTLNFSDWGTQCT